MRRRLITAVALCACAASTALTAAPPASATAVPRATVVPRPGARVSAATAPLGPGASGPDRAITARDIVPSGQPGSVPPPPGADRQARMYDALTPLFGRVTHRALLDDFKAEPLGNAVTGALTGEAVPHAGLRILRDGFDVPHIYGTTRDDVTWGAGWVIAEDRGLLVQQARYDSLTAAIDAPGVSALGLVSSLANFTPSAQTEREVARQTSTLEAAGPTGRAVLHDIDVYLQGINAFIADHGDRLGPFGGVAPLTRTDIYAFTALKDQFVGEGGGDETVNAELLAAFRRQLGAHRGTAVFNDLREANDPETPTSVPGQVHFGPPRRSERGNVALDAGSATAAGAAVAARDAGRGLASNALIVSSARSATRHPLMVAGPQIGFYYPGLTLEEDLEGPGISQRGVSTAPFPGYIFIGRSRDQAWSLTSSALDQIDTYAETLCGHSRHRYLFRGRCRTMQFFDAGRLTTKAGARELTFYRTVHGPVLGYARVHGRLVALSSKRASYGRDALDLLFYHDLAHGLVHNIHQFFRAANRTPQTFNSFYIDSRHFGVFTSGLVPIRPRNVDPALPLDGRGGEEWRGVVPFAEHPHAIDPPSGELVNWNNRTEAGYEAPDNKWMLGAVQRVSLLLRNLGHRRHITPEHMVAAMNEAATQDVREVTLGPVLSRLLRSGRAPSARAARSLALLDAWYRHGASRLDRSGDGEITDPGAAILDAAFPRLATAWAGSVLGGPVTHELARAITIFDAPPNGQFTGWYVWMDKDLRTILGEPVRGAYRVRYCGGGRLTRCRALLWRALEAAGVALARRQGADPAHWHASATAERIHFAPGLLTTTIRYANRPSGIQQILSFR